MPGRFPLMGPVMATLVTLVSLAGCATRHDGPLSDHFDGRVFRNEEPPPPGAFWKFLRWQLLEPGIAWPDHLPVEQDLPPPHVHGDSIRVSYVGHATVLVQVAGVNILTDPVWSERASPLSFAGPKRVREAGVAFERLPPIDIVLVSHNHYDHLDTATLAKLWDRDRPLIVTPLGNLGTMRGKSKDLQAVELDWGQTVHAGAVQITAEPMQHWSARGPIDQNLALWAAFVMKTPSGTLYFAGDTGYGSGTHFKSTREKHGPMRLAILPIGGYEPQWFVGYAHMTPEEAVKAGTDLGAEHVLGHHWATFRMTNESIDEPGQRFATAAERAKLGPDRYRSLLPGMAWLIE